MKEFQDQTGKIISLSNLPRRIVSIVPSQTELLADLGLEEKVIGITKFCIHPLDWFKTRIRIGGTKALKIELIKSLAPDLVLANKEENVKDQVEELEKFVPVWTSDVRNISQAYEMILSVGKITGTTQKAGEMVEKIKNSFSRLQHEGHTSRISGFSRQLRTAYAIWREPLMVAGGDTFIHDMISLCGFRNLFESKNRYPVTTVDELSALDCELLLLPSEPFPFKEKHAEEFRSILSRTHVRLVDGEMFSWYGSRLLYSAEYFQKLIFDVFHGKLSPGNN